MTPVTATAGPCRSRFDAGHHASLGVAPALPVLRRLRRSCCLPGGPDRRSRTRGKHHAAGPVVDALQRRRVRRSAISDPVLALCYVAIVAELARELFFPATGALLWCGALTSFYNVVVLSLPWLLGAAIWSLRDRQRTLAAQAVERQRNARRTPVRQCSQNGSGSPASSTMSWRTT